MAAKRKKKPVQYRFTQKRFDNACDAEHNIDRYLTEETEAEMAGFLDEAEECLKKAGPAFEGHLYMLKKERRALKKALDDLNQVGEEIHLLVTKLGPAGPGTAPKDGQHFFRQGRVARKRASR